MSPLTYALLFGIPFTAAGIVYYRALRLERRRPEPPAGNIHPGAELTIGWLRGYSHSAPTTPLTPEQAHIEWQQHLDCTSDRCARRAAAIETLRLEQHLVPDSRRLR